MLKQERKDNLIIKLISFVIVALVIFFLILGIGGGGKAYADTDLREYSGVLDDLQKDESFNADKYPVKDNDYSLEVIQIAESTAGELFVYVYQPCANIARFPATFVNMALAERVTNGDTSYTVGGDEFNGYMVGGGHGGGGSRPRSAVAPAAVTTVGNDSYQLYSLKLVSGQGVFAKYLVNGFNVLSDKLRFYNIATIYREWVGSVDSPADKDNTTSHVAYKVGQIWTAVTFGNNVEYEAKEIEVVKLTSQMIGVHRYNDGFQFDGTKSLDSHYIAFTCDHKIDKLLSADIEFDTRAYTALAGSGTQYGELAHHRVTLNEYQVASNDGGGWFGKKEEWHRMTAVKEFIKEVDLTETEEKDLLSYDWVLNFYESEFKNAAGGKDVLISGLLPFGFVWTIVNACTTSGELVFDVSLLRLEFEYDGAVYNLGVVSDITTGSNKPTNGSGFWAWLAGLLGVSETACKWIVFGGIALVVLAIALPILSAVFPVVGQVIKSLLMGVLSIFKYLFIGLWFVISLPFRGIAALINKLSERRKANSLGGGSDKKPAPKKPAKPKAKKTGSAKQRSTKKAKK